MHFRSVKDAIALPFHRFGQLISQLPEGFGRAIMGSFGLVAKAGYFWPDNYVRRTVSSFCLATGLTDATSIYFGMVNNIEKVALHYANLYRYGREKLLAQTVLDPKLMAQFRDNGSSGMIILVPHCVAAVLSSAGLHHYAPTTLLVREPKSPLRCQLMLEYLKKLGPKFILSQHTAPATVVRHISRALRDGEIVVGTTDIIVPGPGTVEVRIFGQTVHSPGWPTKIATRFNVPIVPGFIHMDGEQIQLLADDGYLAADLQNSTQRWASSFERWFQQYPSDWVFMLDKRWARVLAEAATSRSRNVPRSFGDFGRTGIKSSHG
jgi:lauroyl/myristoyl acyltransferase